MAAHPPQVGRARTILRQALGQLGGAPRRGTALGLMARWAGATGDGDLTGPTFPAWLTDLVGRAQTIGLADRRGECIHSACAHYNLSLIHISEPTRPY